MDKSIIRRYIAGRANPSEIKQVHAWLDQPGSDHQMEEMLEEVWCQKNNVPRDLERNERLLAQINSRIQKNKQPAFQDESIFNLALIRSAAACLLLIGLAFLGFQVMNEHQGHSEEIKSTVHWVERSVLPGQKLVLELPDASKIWVNANSKIRFPEKFSRDSREVFLEGEAFFEVSHDGNRPFRVHSGELTTEVLGTKFNIKSQGKNTDVTLLEGKVSVKINKEKEGILILNPGQLAAYRQGNPEKLQLATFESQDPFLWKDGLIHFKNENIKNIMESLENWYGVSIKTRGHLDLNRTVSGTFTNDNLDNMLTGLGFTLDFTHELENNVVTIYPQ
ncbi:FecR domain-containing protein [Cyclobacterium sp.]|uniref:FecR family protein n=1 Tax=Cyclobacterium sp. TaxID=1966343 RepID=UPI0019B493D1|nr:FecR domain-containing protein [Cyclobacterium sp.]MBD3630303.1 FecR domain-containing protein [Cyclobacterium sp.]